MIEQNSKMHHILPLIFNITQEQIAILDQENTNGQGWDRYCNGQVIHATFYKNEIFGIIREYLEDFKVQVKIDEHELFCNCSCNSENPICEHIVALLYSWIYDKDEFINLDNFMDKLQYLDKDMLIEAVEKFLVDDPRNIRFFKREKEVEISDIDCDNLAFD